MYTGASINSSATFTGVASAAITNGAGKAVKLDANGGVVLCSKAGDVAIGVLLLDSPDSIAAGESVTYQIKDIGSAVAGVAIAAGSAVATDANGKFAPAVATNFIVGYAMTAASGDKSIFLLDIRKSGYQA
jgi:hypothetical protein